MSFLSRITLLRHGETVGESSIRFHGATDVALSRLGCDQAAAARRALAHRNFDLVVASPLQRAWKSASIVAPGAPIRLESQFREIDFGRWEGLTREEIQRLDPSIYDEWQQLAPDFVFPEGERRSDFHARVIAGLAGLLRLKVESLLIVAHKGVVRSVYQELVGEQLPAPNPELGQHVEIVREARGAWVSSAES